MKFRKVGIKVINRIFIIIICFFLFSCKQETSRENIPKKDVVVRIQLADTIQLKDTIFGVVIMNPILIQLNLHAMRKGMFSCT